MIIKTDDQPESEVQASAQRLMRMLLPEELVMQPGFLLGRTADLLRAHLNACSCITAPGLGLRLRHIGMMVVLKNRGALRQTDLTFAVNSDRTTITKLVDELEGLGLVHRERDQSDRRANAVSLTPAGQGLLDSMLPRMRSIEERFLAPLSAQEQALLTELLKRLLAAREAGLAHD